MALNADNFKLLTTYRALSLHVFSLEWSKGCVFM